MSKPAKKRPTASARATVPMTKSSRHGAGDPEPKRADRGSKQSRVIALLQSPTGATIEAMIKATGWQPHSVRGFLAGVVRKRLKLKLGSKKVDGNRVYQIASGDRGKTASPQPQRRPAQPVHDRRAGGDPLRQNPWHQASALAHCVADAATHEGRGHRARQQDRTDSVGDDGQGRTL